MASGHHISNVDGDSDTQNGVAGIGDTDGNTNNDVSIGDSGGSADRIIDLLLLLVTLVELAVIDSGRVTEDDDDREQW